MTLPLQVHVWVQEMLANRGGIQAFSGHLVRALELTLGRESVQVFSKNDRQSAVTGKGAVSFCGSGAWPENLRAVGYASRVLADGYRQRPDLILVTHLNLAPVARWLKRLTGVPYVCVAHGIEAWELRNRARKAALRDADSILAVSSYTRDRLIREQSLVPDRVGILPNTISADVFRPGPKPERLLGRHAIDPNKKIILTVARLKGSEGYKGYDQVLRCLPRIRQTVPNVHYVLVGKGDDQARINGLVAELQLEGCVTLAGHVSDGELVDYYNLCDVFAMPSKGEGFGIVYLEALACGKPVLAGNSDGSSEPLQHGEIGVLVPPDDIGKIAESLIAILNHTYPVPILYRPEELRTRTLAAFGIERFTATLAEFLGKFSANHGKALAADLPTESAAPVRALNRSTLSESP